MTRTTLLALAERVEAATGADRELDALIAAACRVTLPKGCDWALKFPKWEGVRNGEVRIIGNVNGNGDYIAGSFVSIRYTASLDAALSLVPSGFNFSLDRIGDRCGCIVNHTPDYKTAHIVDGCATPALALTAASLRAIAGSLPND